MSSRETLQSGLLSSRLGRAPDARPEWFVYLRAALRRIRDARHVAVTAVGTAAEPFVTRGAKLFGASLRRLESLDQRPDAAIVQESDRAYVLAARPGGNVASLIDQRLSDPACDPSAVWLADHASLIGDELRQSWLARGATKWRVDGAFASSARDEATRRASIGDDAAQREARAESSRESWTGSGSHTDGESIQFSQVPSCDLLLHCTRRREGPWPDQPIDEYLDELILGSPAADRSPLASLRRILVERRIRASSLAIRGGHRVVSFTAEPLENVHRLRAFRSHRHRWDFEPFGVAIRRDWLVGRGARPVIYGDQSDWDRLSVEDRPFFQRRTTQSRSSDVGVDWTVEQEWRRIGDVDLAEVPAAAAWIFVPDASAARAVSGLARWPVVLVPGSSGS